jgi:hypothetical protein
VPVPFLFGQGCLLLAQSGHADGAPRCPLLGVKRTSQEAAVMSSFDPSETSRPTTLQLASLIGPEQTFCDFMLICISHKFPSLVTRCQTYKWLGSARGSRHSARDFLDEFVQFVADDVADRPQVEPVLRPMPAIIALDALGIGPEILFGQVLRDE